MRVHVIGEDAAQSLQFASALNRAFLTTHGAIARPDLPKGMPDVIVIAVDLKEAHNIDAIKALSNCIVAVPERIYITPQSSRLSLAQGYALGASTVLAGPLGCPRLQSRVMEHILCRFAAQGSVNEACSVARDAAIAIDRMFKALLDGGDVDILQAQHAGRQIAEAVARDGLSNWLAVVRSHHEGTFQHCLLVTGVVVDFGLQLGVSKLDMERLYTAAMLHDIGKARIPARILDKPGLLDPEERAVIETHPILGYEALRRNSAASVEVLDAVLHHHEYLDGSGYPDKLRAGSIGDIVRVLTISDIFAALVEHRAYRPAMPRRQAYDVLLRMEGRLEKALVRAFEKVALSD